jgi:hypothetical protein
MEDNKERIKQMITVELENARMWASFITPVIALVFAILFTDQFFPGKLLARIIVSWIIFHWVLYALDKRNEHLSNANDLILKLK